MFELFLLAFRNKKKEAFKIKKKRVFPSNAMPLNALDLSGLLDLHRRFLVKQTFKPCSCQLTIYCVLQRCHHTLGTCLTIKKWSLKQWS